MAESFVISLSRAAGIVSTSTAGAIGVTTNLITGISTVGVAVSDLVVNGNYISGTKVTIIGVNSTTVDRDSTNEAAASSQTVTYLGPTTAYTSAAATKAILIGGTFANNTNNEVELTVAVWDNSAATETAIASKVPVPYGSSFVVSDAGKTVMEGDDQIRIYANSANAIDATLSILKGVS